MSVQKTPDRKGGIDDKKVQWEEDLKPFKRLPREPRTSPRQRVPAFIPALVSFALVGVACVLAASFINQNRPALNFTAPTATIIIITPTATEFVPPTATPYIAPTETPLPTAAAPAEGAPAGGIVIGSKIVIVDTGGNGLNFRDGPSRTANKIRSLPEGSTYEVVGGPQQADSLVWWQLKDPTDGTVGWGAQNYMRPAN
jgi:hypothetical protein